MQDNHNSKLLFKSNLPAYSEMHILLFISIITFIKSYFLWGAPHNLFFDEAQYWFWSKHLDWGYYSKPPMVAWAIALTTSFCGEGEACIRLSSPIAHGMTTFFVYAIGRELYSARVGFYSALTYLTLPAVFVSSFLVSTDPFLLMFWAGALWAFVKATRTNQWRYWIAAGFMAGGGMLSKYNMLTFLVSSMCVLSILPSYRQHLKNLRYWLSAFIAFLVFLPNILWNISHHFVSFLHTKDNANFNFSDHTFHLDKMLEFIGQQFGVFGPVLFFVLLSLLVRVKFARDERYAWLYWFVVPLLGLIVIISLLSRAHANWAAPVYVAASIWVVAYLIEAHKLWLVKLSIALHLVLAALVLAFPIILSTAGFIISYEKSDIKNKQIYDPFIQTNGWENLGQQVAAINTKNLPLLVDTRKLYAELSYYIKPAPVNMVKWNPDGAIRDHFDLVAGLQNVPVGTSFMVVLDDLNIEIVAPYFKNNKHITTITLHNQHPENRDYEVYYVEGFKGLP